MAKRPTHRPGDLFALPIMPDCYAVALAARACHPRYSVYICIPQQSYPSPPTVEEAVNDLLSKPLKHIIASDLSIRSGRWQRLGAFPSWDPTAFPIPPVLSPNSRHGQIELYQLSDETLTPKFVLKGAKMPGLFLPDGCSGSGAAEIQGRRFILGE